MPFLTRRRFLKAMGLGAMGAVALLWLGTTSVHFVQPREADIKA